MTNLTKFSTALLHPRYWLTRLGIGTLVSRAIAHPVIYRLGCGLENWRCCLRNDAQNCASQPGTVLLGK